MAILVSLFGALGRFAGKIVNAALGWASILLFGRVPHSKQILLSFVSLGSIAWIVALLGVLLPDVGTFLIAAVPAPAFIDRNLIRLAMLIGAIVLPLGVGLAALFLVRNEERPTGLGERIWAVLHGYVFCAVLAVMLVFLAAIALARKGRAAVKRWEDAHVPIVVKPGHYEEVVAALRDALDAAKLGVAEEAAPAVLAAPAKILGAVSGPGVKDMVPDRLMELKAKDLEVLVYPSDIALSGTKHEVARARAAVASRLTTAPAYMTTSEEAEKVEDRIEAIGRALSRRQTSGSPAADLRRRLDEIDRTLADLVIPYDEWEVLYRMRLQIERELLTGEEPGQTLAAGAVQADPLTAGSHDPRAAAGARGPQSRPASNPAGGAAAWAASLGSLALIGLDVALTLLERVSPPRRRRRLPWQNGE